MSTETLESTETQQPAKLDGRTKAGKAAKAAAQAAAAEQEAAPVTLESATSDQIETILDNLEPTAAVEAQEPQVEAQEQEPQAQEPQAQEQEHPDLGMGLFKGGANLFIKEEHRDFAKDMAEHLGVELKETKNGNPYITVARNQIDQVVEAAQAAGLTVDDARPREQERFAEKQQAKEALRFEGAGSMLIQAASRMLQTGKTFVPGKELNVFQTKESIAEQAKLAEARQDGKDVKDKPIEIGIWDKRAELLVAKGTVGRDDKGQVEVKVTIDNIAQVNEKRPENLQLIIPTREQVVEGLQNTIQQRAEVRASEPIKKKPASVER